MNEKGTEESLLSREDAKQIVLHSEITFVYADKNPDDELPTEDMQKDYVFVDIPFAGLELWGKYLLERDNENFTDEITNYSGDEESFFRYYVDELRESPAWKNQEKEITPENIEEYRNGKRWFEFVVPCDRQVTINAAIDVVREALDNTVIAEQLKPADWKFHELPNEWILSFWLDKESFALMCIPEVFNSKWYIAYAKHECKNDVRVKYDEFFDKENSHCINAVVKFWTAMGLYADENRVAPIAVTEFDNVDDPDLFDEEAGIRWDLAQRLMLWWEESESGYNLKEAF